MFKICVRYLGDPGYQQGIDQELDVSQATVSRTVNRVVNSIVAQSNEWIKFPTTIHELMEAKRIWQGMYTFPTAIGVIDCSHIGILKPNRLGDEYINRKGKPTSVGVSWPGSVHDSRIWKNSQTRSQLINKANVVLLGDAGYGIEPCLMTPYRNPTPGAEIYYKKLLKQERVIIERCFNSAVCEVMKKTRNTILLRDSGYGIMSCLMTPYTDPQVEYQRVFNRLLTSERVVTEHTFGQNPGFVGSCHIMQLKQTFVTLSR
ncbi:unnamed protein product [Acanthoscelides obtectus]|uniref:DDE Tnp4 domain-containing protein n=1 Tax=Acanthoscelides obtectus TaxID=200917 RepID=A0A9P0Q012_ACAOB|nr:unnamed protein product [Acanthoscelides obtectus]CAK1659696.1 Putative nuclease HARBI1 [Acanthoscelides obtectus]